MPWTWYEAEVVRIEDASSITKRFWMKVPQEEAVNFKAGQFFTMDLPIHERRNKRWRSYSIASPPAEDNLFEFCIVRLEGGAGTRYFFEEVKEGTTIRFKGPSGNFVLREPVDYDLVFICTGTGVAPFRSMIQDLHRQGKPYRNIHLIFGTRYAENILYRQEFEQLLREMPNFRYSVALSREDPLDPKKYDFPIVKGYVHQLYQEEYAAKRPDVQFYICGWSNMIDDAMENLLIKMGYDKGQIHFELYG